MIAPEPRDSAICRALTHADEFASPRRSLPEDRFQPGRTGDTPAPVLADATVIVHSKAILRWIARQPRSGAAS